MDRKFCAAMEVLNGTCCQSISLLPPGLALVLLFFGVPFPLTHAHQETLARILKSFFLDALMGSNLLSSMPEASGTSQLTDGPWQ